MSKDHGSQYVEAVSQGDFTKLHDLFSEDIVFLAATQEDSWHAIGWPETEKALQELDPPGAQVSEVVSVAPQWPVLIEPVLSGAPQAVVRHLPPH